jgi:hypothetical protein
MEGNSHVAAWPSNTRYVYFMSTTLSADAGIPADHDPGAQMNRPEEIVTYRIKREWSVRNAKWHYIVYAARGDDRTRSMRLAEGNRAWAEKNARHFGIEIEGEDIDDDDI